MASWTEEKNRKKLLKNIRRKAKEKRKDEDEERGEKREEIHCVVEWTRPTLSNQSIAVMDKKGWTIGICETLRPVIDCKWARNYVAAYWNIRYTFESGVRDVFFLPPPSSFTFFFISFHFFFHFSFSCASSFLSPLFSVESKLAKSIGRSGWILWGSFTFIPHERFRSTWSIWNIFSKNKY